MEKFTIDKLCKIKQLLIWLNERKSTDFCIITEYKVYVTQLECSDSETVLIINYKHAWIIKNWFNLLTYSEIKEQKSYDLTTCKIIIDEEETIYNKIAEINFLLLEYDIILVSTHFMEIIQKIPFLMKKK